MLSKLVYIYYKWQIHKAVSRSKWESSSGLLGIFGASGISSVICKIKNGSVSRIFLNLEQKDELLKYCFKKIIDLDSDKEIVKQLILLFVDNCIEYITIWLRKRISLLKLPIVKEAILSSHNMNQYIFDLLSINNSGDGDEEFVIPSIGAKNSVPLELVEKMYELQAKGCPSKKNNKNEEDNDQAISR